MNGKLFTIGHSNRTTDELVVHLKRHNIEQLCDVRAFPRSRRHPHFDKAQLSATLAHNHIDYRWMGKALGGYRKPRAGSPHSALHDASFRGFADYMSDERFMSAVESIVATTALQRVAIMCAEANHQHCHRQFIADHLTLAGHDVLHIGADGKIELHRLHACLNATKLPPVYNKHEQGDLFSDLKV